MEEKTSYIQGFINNSGQNHRTCLIGGKVTTWNNCYAPKVQLFINQWSSYNFYLAWCLIEISSFIKKSFFFWCCPLLYQIFRQWESNATVHHSATSRLLILTIYVLCMHVHPRHTDVAIYMYTCWTCQWTILPVLLGCLTAVFITQGFLDPSKLEYDHLQSI